jgi:hypothetical protein
MIDLEGKSQEQAILEYLQGGAALTPLDALRLFGCMRLGARIWDLRRKGYNISMRVIETPSGKHVAEYRMEQRCETNI